VRRVVCHAAVTGKITNSRRARTLRDEIRFEKKDSNRDESAACLLNVLL